ncbi:MAG TPA: sulfatase [Dongiaceae bacterium]|nr:sulfatase [Dongiaceae bacterium]
MRRLVLGCLVLCLVQVGLLQADVPVEAPPDTRPDGPAGPPGGAAGNRPNFIIIYADDLGWMDTGFQGSRYYETPNLDRLARAGMVFRSAYANSPVCAPSRASLLSGEYPPRHGVYTVGSAERGPAHLRRWVPVPNATELKRSVITIPEALKSAGYVSASIGKWHLGDDPGAGPRAQGFDLNAGGNHNGHLGSYFSPYGIVELQDGPVGEYLTDRLTNEAIKFITANAQRPFFLYLSHYAVHTPLQAKRELIDKYKAKAGSQGQDEPVYAAMIESLDQGVGAILDTLDRLGLASSTVVFFLSDNGGVADVTSMGPLRGAKGSFYEGGLRVPMAVRWPGKTPAGSVTDTPVSGVDLFPTILQMAHVRVRPGQILDGDSLVSLLQGKDDLRGRAIYWHFPGYMDPDAGRRGPFGATPCSVVRVGDWKLIEKFEDDTIEMYDLGRDPGEKTNLAASNADKAKELSTLLLDWRASIGAVLPTVRNPRYNPEAPVVMVGGKYEGE